MRAAGIHTLFLISCLFVSLANAQQPDRPVILQQVGHSSGVTAIAISPNSRLAATASNDNTISVWDVESGVEIVKFTSHEAPVTGVAFCSNNTSLVSASSDTTVRLWDVKTRTQVISKPINAVFSSVAVSSDCKTAYLGDSHGSLLVWDVGSDRFKSISELSNMRRVAISSSGRYVVAAGDRGNLGILDTRDSSVKTVQTQSSDPAAVGFFQNEESVWVAGFGVLTTWSRLPGATPVALAQVRDAVALYPGEDAIAELRDGKLLKLSLSSGRIQSPVDLSSSALKTIRASALAFVGNNKLFIGSGDGEGFILSHSAEIKVRKLGNRLAPVYFASANDDGSELLVGNTTGRFTQLSLSSNSPLLLDSNLNSEGPIWSFSWKTRKALNVYRGGEFNILEIDTMSRRSLTPKIEPKATPSATSHGRLIGQKFSKDGKHLYIGYEDGTIMRYRDEAAAGFVGDVFWSPPAAGITWLQAFEVSPDESLLMLAGNTREKNGTVVSLINTSTRETRSIRPSNSGFATRLILSPSGKKLLITFDDLIGEDIPAITEWGRLIDLESLMGTDLIGIVHVVIAAAFGADDSLIVTGSKDGVVRLWNTLAPNPEPVALGSHTGWVSMAVRVGETNRVVTAGLDGNLMLWDLSKRQQLCRIIDPVSTDRVVIDPDGRFDSRNLESLTAISWLFPDDPFRPLPPEIFMRQYFEPRLLGRLLDPKNKFEDVPPLALLNRQQPDVEIKTVKVDATGNRVAVTVRVANVTGSQMRNGKMVQLRSGVYDVRLFRDGQLVAYVPGEIDLAADGTAIIEREVKLPRRSDLSEIKFSAYALNVEGVKSTTATFSYKPEKPLQAVKGKAYIISVGVNAYEDNEWDLSYAAQDAEISEKMLVEKLNATGAYAVISVKLQSDYEKTAKGRKVTQQLATKENFQAVLDVIAHGPSDARQKQLKRIPGADQLKKAEPEDLVLIFFSSHGYTNQQGKFYLVPYNTGGKILFSKDREIQNDSLKFFISSDELSKWVRDIDADELVMIVDTCHSAGAVEEPGFKPGPMGARGMGQLAYDKGMKVLAASQADDVAFELGKLRQGLLTYALMREGLDKTRADRNANGRITLNEWLSFGAARVPGLYEDVKLGRVEVIKSKDLEITAILSGNSVKKGAFQQPRLFDFKRIDREITLAVN